MPRRPGRRGGYARGEAAARRKRRRRALLFGILALVSCPGLGGRLPSVAGARLRFPHRNAPGRVPAGGRPHRGPEVPAGAAKAMNVLVLGSDSRDTSAGAGPRPRPGPPPTSARTP